MRHVVKGHIQSESLLVETFSDLQCTEKNHTAQYDHHQDGNAGHVDSAFPPVGEGGTHFHADGHSGRMIEEILTSNKTVPTVKLAREPNHATPCLGQQTREQRV